MAQEAQAGLLSWWWGEPRHEQLEQALSAAHHTVHTAGQLVESQSRQAAAQAEQNSRVASLLGELAQERQLLAAHLTQLDVAHRRESVLAAALQATAPAVVSGTALLLGSVAVWAMTRSGAGDADTSGVLIDLLSQRQPVTSAHTRRARAQRLHGKIPPRRLPTLPPRDDAEPPF